MIDVFLALEWPEFWPAGCSCCKHLPAHAMWALWPRRRWLAEALRRPPCKQEVREPVCA